MRQLECRASAGATSQVESSTMAVFSAVSFRRTLSFMFCPACGTPAREGARFCATCGVTLEVSCPGCGASADLADRFCSSCGAPLERAVAPVSPPAQEERKTVTCLYADLVGSTAAADRADPEDVQARLAPYHARLRDELQRFGATVEKFIGDAVVGVFGPPVAHEDDAERT